MEIAHNKQIFLVIKIRQNKFLKNICFHLILYGIKRLFYNTRLFQSLRSIKSVL